MSIRETSRRNLLTAGVAVAVATAGAGAVRAEGTLPEPDTTLRAAIAAYRAAGAAWVKAVKKAGAAETKGRAACDVPHPGPWGTWREAHHPEGSFIGTDPQTGPAHKALLAELRALPQNERGGIIWKDGYAGLVADAMVDASNTYYAPIRPTYDAQIERHNDALNKALEEAGYFDLDEAADEASDCLAAARTALLAIRPQTAAGFVAKVEALLKGECDLDEAIQEGEAQALLVDIAALAAGGAA